ncbi:hypothetical protein LWI29_017865 [Acer saccharum]|uniref:Uncharacterized protein n=1 Tax=Acer saccharum TaxID=4024 RepID=A0AA39SDU0_ACESA|nr:hypothetical protein LWI29_017865 [Acer saccharum]
MGLFSGMYSLRLVAVLMLLLMVANATAHELALPNSKPGCLRECGELDIPYPFGTRAGCYLNEDFLITCNTTHNPPTPFWGDSNIPVTNINMDGQLQIQTLVSKDCYNKTDRIDSIWNTTLWLAKTTISDAQNKFTVVGCDSYGYIRGKIGDKNYRGGCISSCGSKDDVMDGSCFGSGCCQIDIPKGLKEIAVEAYSFNGLQNVSQFNPCSYAFVIDDSQFNFSSSNLSIITERVPTVIHWAITGQGECEEARRNKTSYACKQNSECYETDANNSVRGYLCRCKDGYEGNPYLSCRDIDECENGNHLCSKHAKCTNIEGNYTCECIKGYNGEGRKDGDSCMLNQSSTVITKIVTGVGLSFVILLVFSSWLYFMFKKRRLVKLKEFFFQQNGGILLQQQLSKQSGSCDTAKIFSEKELKKATNNFDEKRIIGRGGYGTVYKGFLKDDKPVAIKKSKIVDKSQIEQFINELMTGKKVVSFARSEEERSLVNYFLFVLNEGCFFEILENGMVNDDNTEHIRKVAELARRCLRVKGVERPTMMEVAMELEGLRRMLNVEVDIE